MSRNAPRVQIPPSPPDRGKTTRRRGVFPLRASSEHYPQIQHSGKVTVQELAERAAEVSTLSPVDVAAAIEAFLAIVPDELADGNIVSLGNFGTFRLRMHGEGAATAEEVTARNIAKTLSPLPTAVSVSPGAPTLPRPETGLCQSRPVELERSGF